MGEVSALSPARPLGNHVTSLPRLTLTVSNLFMADRELKMATYCPELRSLSCTLIDDREALVIFRSMRHACKPSASAKAWGSALELVMML